MSIWRQNVSVCCLRQGFDSQQVLDAVAEAGYQAEEKGKDKPSDVSEEAVIKAQKLQKRNKSY